MRRLQCPRGSRAWVLLQIMGSEAQGLGFRYSVGFGYGFVVFGVGFGFRVQGFRVLSIGHRV